jgi:hypothetical protein
VTLTLRLLLGLLGAVAVLICASIMIAGAEATAWTAEKLFSALTASRAPLSEAWPPTMDSELRFYAALWGAYGVVCLTVARDLANRASLVPWLAGVFFLGGVGRLLSLVTIGTPHPFFIFLMWVELVLPLILVLLWRRSLHR